MSNLKVILVLSTVLLFAACSPHETKEEKEYRQKVAEIIRSVSDSNKELEERAIKSKMRLIRTLVELRREERPGGQPGFVHLNGDLVVAENTLDRRISVQLSAGKNWEGKNPEVEEGTLRLTRNGIIDRLENDESFITFGCSERPEMRGLIERKIDEAAVVVAAHTVLICDASRIGGSVKKIVASVMILSNIKLEIARKGDFGFSAFELNAEELILEGQNKLNLIGVNDGSLLRIQRGPSLSITARQLRGAGTLEIVSQGADHKE